MGMAMDVDCKTVRRFLYLAVDPLGEIRPADWMVEHLDACMDCEREYWRLGELRDIVTVSEIIALNGNTSIDEFFHEPKPNVVREILRLSTIEPGNISCEQVRPYYHSIATCTSKPPVAAEIYLHARNCIMCLNCIIQLRSKLGVAIPDTH